MSVFPKKKKEEYGLWSYFLLETNFVALFPCYLSKAALNNNLYICIVKSAINKFDLT